MNDNLISEIDWYISYVCKSIPARYREDVKQDIYLQLFEEIEKRKLPEEERIEFCFKNIRNYRKKYSKKYRNDKEIGVDNLDNIPYEEQTPYSGLPYNIKFDLDKITPHLTDKQNSLLKFVMVNGINVSYSEINEELGYKSRTQGMWTLRSLMQKMRQILSDEDPSKYNHSQRYLRYNK